MLRKHEVTPAALLTLWTLALLCGSIQTPAAAQDTAQPAPKPASALDPQRDPRLNARVSITAYHTTVGRLLAELSRQTGVRLRPGAADVREEEIIVFLKARPLHASLRLLAEEFHWDPERGYGWFWIRTTRNGVPEYELHKDLATRRLPEEMLLRDRRWLAEDLERALATYQKQEGPGLRGVDVLATVPQTALRAALEGKKVILPWDQCPDALREIGRRYFEGGADERTWVEVSTQGAGPNLKLRIFFQLYGRGGAGRITQPPGYLDRFRNPQLVRVPELRVPPFTGLAAQVLAVKPEEVASWKEARTMPRLLSLIVERTGSDIICDGYAYGVNWAAFQALANPFGKPLGLCLNSLSMRLRLP